MLTLNKGDVSKKDEIVAEGYIMGLKKALSIIKEANASDTRGYYSSLSEFLSDITDAAERNRRAKYYDERDGGREAIGAYQPVFCVTDYRSNQKFVAAVETFEVKYDRRKATLTIKGEDETLVISDFDKAFASANHDADTADLNLWDVYVNITGNKEMHGHFNVLLRRNYEEGEGLF